ncbi:hypothetical protein CDAR_70181 [Caerostris darwini]|uniref:C2H2-type domain-containing protein n=1 Tax=Caerostris darwini TaxID=1538125 RepID=A0AAV4TGJ1_9ARAC|nr:hypothetical protein CDAR_70181 [Caerostris darwini]
MSKDEKKFVSFAEISSDEEENISILEWLLRAPAGSNVQNQLARGNVGDGSNGLSSDFCRHASGPRNPICTNMGAEGGLNVVRSSENVQQSAGYSLLQPTSNNRNISNTIDSASGCSVRNKKMRTCEMNPNEHNFQPLDFSIRGASYKTDVISGGENCSCQKTQNNTFTSSAECSSSAPSSTRNSGDQGRKHVCDVCRNELSNLSSLKRHKRAHYGEKQFKCNTCPNRYARHSHLQDHMSIHTG